MGDWIDSIQIDPGSLLAGLDYLWRGGSPLYGAVRGYQDQGLIGIINAPLLVGSPIIGGAIDPNSPFDPTRAGEAINYFLGGSTPYLGGSGGPSDGRTPESIQSAKNFLYVEGAILAGIAAAPFVYTALQNTKKKKGKLVTAKQAKLAESLESASTKAIALLQSFGPMIALPMAYITVQKMEDADFISTGLGNDVQALMTVAASSAIISSVAGAGKSIAAAMP